MNPSRLIPRAVPAAVLTLVLGCGGGGSGEVSITSQNAEALAAAGVGAASMLQEMSDMVDGFSGMFNPAAQLVPCDSGNVTLSIQDMGTTGLSTGDYANVDFNGCVLDLGGGSLTFNGMFYIEATDIMTDPQTGAFTREFYASYDALTAVILGATVVIDGGLTAGISSPDGVTLVADVSGGSFSAFAKSGGQVFSGSLSNFHSTRSLDTSTNTYSVDFEATVKASGLGGSAHFLTTVPFTGAVDDNPSAGTLVATGAMGGTITLTALDNVNVRILVDADGDGIDETEINTTWDALQNQG